MAYDQGGGGGRSVTDTASNFRYYLTKPYELTWPPSAEQWANLEQMLIELYDAGRILLTSLEDGGVLDEDGAASGGGGDVVGPDSATDGNIVTFDGATGKLIQDSGLSASSFLQTAAFNVAEVTLTDAQVKALTTTPITIIPAPGANKYIRIFGGISFFTQVTVAFNATVTTALRYTNETNLTTGSVTIVANGSTGQRFGYNDTASDTVNGSDVINSAVEVFASAGVPTTGTTTAGTKIVTAYAIFDIPA